MVTARRKHILLVHRYYWPDVPAYAQMLHIMAQRFVEFGYDVTVFSTHPSYNDVYRGPSTEAVETVEGVRIRRVRLLKERKGGMLRRSVNVALFCTELFVHCLWNRYDLMTVSSFPPVVMGFVGRILRMIRGTQYLYHCQDLYPEVACASGVARPGLVSRIAMSIDRRNCVKAAAVVVLSEDMRATIADRGISTENVYAINNFIIEHFESGVDLPVELVAPLGVFQVIFAGNMGRFQGLETLIKVAGHFRSNEPIRFVFVGGGVLVDELKREAGDLLEKTVFFAPHQPLSSVMQMIHKARLSVVSLGPGVIRCAYPSKTMSYLEAGAKLLLVLERDSELARFVENEQLGVCLEQNDLDGIVDAIRAEMLHVDDCALRRQQVARSVFGQATILSKWEDLLGALLCDQSVSRG